jgi:hypothetical protein
MLTVSPHSSKDAPAGTPGEARMSTATSPSSLGVRLGRKRIISPSPDERKHTRRGWGNWKRHAKSEREQRLSVKAPLLVMSKHNVYPSVGKYTCTQEQLLGVLVK